MNGIAKKCLAGSLIAALLFAVSGCGAGKPESASGTPNSSGVLEKTEKTAKETGREEMEKTGQSSYDEILEGLYAIISNPDEEDYEDVPGAAGVWEIASYEAGDDALNALGYITRDISGDGIPELMVGTTQEYGAWVCAVYTLIDGEPQLVLEGWYRNRYVYAPDGTFYNVGSNGAASSCIGTYKITRDGTKLKCQDLYFTDFDEDFGDIRVYYNTTGSLDPAESKETDMTEEDFWTMQDLPACDWRLTLFSAFGPDVLVQWLDDVGTLEDYEECSMVSGGEEGIKLVFIPRRPVELFTILSLTQVDVSDSGDIEFETYPEAWPMDEDGFVRPFVAEIPFPEEENLIQYGFQYEDENENMRRFAIEIDRRKGDAIVVREADPEYFNFILRGEEETEAYSDRIPVLTYGRLPFDDMEEITADEHNPDGGYYYEDMVVGGTASVINCAYASMREEYDVDLEDYIRDWARGLTEYETSDVNVEKNETYSENLGYPVYIVQFTTGENEDTRFWTVYGTEANGYLYLYAFNIWADAEEEHDRVWEVFDGLMFSD